MKPDPAIVLLSGGMDSTVALFWAIREKFDPIRVLFIDYEQRARVAEWDSVLLITGEIGLKAHKIELPGSMFASNSSILGRAPIDKYATVEEAVRKTSTDKSYLPLRNAVFTTIAAHHLIAEFPKGGSVVLGVRSRSDGPGGFPDCTAEFALQMSNSLSQAAGVHINVETPLNLIPSTSRAKTIELAHRLPGCFEALKYTVTCYEGTRCGKCLPCLRRAQAFEIARLVDPAA